MSAVLQQGARWLRHYPAGVPPRLEYPRAPVWWLLEQTARYCGARTACRFYHQDLTYAQLWETVRRAAAGLAAAGVKPGDRVGVLLPNCPEYFLAVYGIWLSGATVVSLSPLAVVEEISALLQSTDCRRVVVLDLLVHLVHPAEGTPQQIWTVTLQDRLPFWQRWGYRVARTMRAGWRKPSRTSVLPFARLLTEPVVPLPDRSEDAHDRPAYLLCTGGTTGAPKTALLTHGNLLANAWQVLHWSGSRCGAETILAVLPFFHSYGLTTCVTSGVAWAATLIVRHRFRPRQVIQAIEQYRPTVFYAVPTMLAKLNQCLADRPADLSSLQWCIAGGAALDPAIAAEFARRSGAQVVEGYGLSEASPVTHVNPLDGTARPGTIGLPLPDTDARIVDAETGEGELPPGEVGELVVRGPQVMAGYWNDPPQTARVLRDRWLYTGDLATCDEDGFFRIVGRKKDLIITSGYSVYPRDVESVLRRYPGVTDVAVVGVPDPERGEVIKAVLVVPKRRRFHRRRFDHFVREHLAGPKRPHLVEIVDELPRNFLGKVLRRKLREGTGKADVVRREETP